MKNQKRSLFHRYRSSISVIVVVFSVALIAFIGVWFLVLSHAATASLSLEPENGTRIGSAQSVAAIDASGGKAVQFANPVIPAAKPCTKDPYSFDSSIYVTWAKPGFKVVDRKVHKYRVYGNTAQEIANQIKACKPTTTITTNSFVYWQLTYSYWKTITASGSCNVGKEAVGIEVQQTYPYWEPTVNAEPGLATKWQQYTKAMETYENNKRNIIINKAKQYYAHLLSYADAPNCATADTAITAMYNSDFAAIDKAVEAYKTQTQNGNTLGAVWP